MQPKKLKNEGNFTFKKKKKRIKADNFHFMMKFNFISIPFSAAMYENYDYTYCELSFGKMEVYSIERLNMFDCWLKKDSCGKQINKKKKKKKKRRRRIKTRKNCENG